MTDIDLDALRGRADEFRRWIQRPGEFSISDAEADAWGDRVPALIAAVQRRDDALAAVLALHAPSTFLGEPCCLSCCDNEVGEPLGYPCPTVAAITAHLAPADNPTTEEDR